MNESEIMEKINEVDEAMKPLTENHKSGLSRNYLDIVFAMAKQSIPEDKAIDWEDVCASVFFLQIPPRSDSTEWAYHVQLRNRIREAINQRAARTGENWRIKPYVKGKSIIKRSRSRMVRNESITRMKRISGAFDNIQSHLKPMAASDGLTENDLRVIQQMSDLVNGARMALAGMSHQLSSLSIEDRQYVVSLFIEDQTRTDGS